jgi:hypothetical protein
LQQTSGEEQRDHGEAEAQPGQRELRQQRNRALREGTSSGARGSRHRRPDPPVCGHKNRGRAEPLWLRIAGSGRGDADPGSFHAVPVWV